MEKNKKDRRPLTLRCWDGTNMIYPWTNTMDVMKKFMTKVPLDGLLLLGAEDVRDVVGKTIYEGDIVTYERKVMENYEFVHYEVHDVIQFRGGWLSASKSSFGWEGEDLVDLRECRVVGNIYQNKGLIARIGELPVKMVIKAPQEPVETAKSDNK